MIDRNSDNENKKDVIEMEKKIDTLQELINEEKQKDRIALRKANTIISQKDEKFKEILDIIKNSKNSELKNELLDYLNFKGE